MSTALRASGERRYDLQVITETKSKYLKQKTLGQTRLLRENTHTCKLLRLRSPLRFDAVQQLRIDSLSHGVSLDDGFTCGAGQQQLLLTGAFSFPLKYSAELLNYSRSRGQNSSRLDLLHLL